MGLLEWNVREKADFQPVAAAGEGYGANGARASIIDTASPAAELGTLLQLVAPDRQRHQTRDPWQASTLLLVTLPNDRNVDLTAPELLPEEHVRQMVAAVVGDALNRPSQRS